MQSTIFSLGYQVMEFSGNLRAWKLNKAQTKQTNIMGVISGINMEWCQLFLILFYLLLLFIPTPTPPPPLHGGRSWYPQSARYNNTVLYVSKKLFESVMIPHQIHQDGLLLCRWSTFWEYRNRAIGYKIAVPSGSIDGNYRLINLFSPW